MQNITSKNDKKIVAWKIVSGICIFAAVMYFIGFYMWAMDIFEGQTQELKMLYTKVNPFTFGTYFLGISVLLFCAFYKNKVLKAILCTFYIIVIFFSLVAIMGMNSATDLLIYAPHLLIIGGIVYTFWKSWKENH